MSATLAPVPTPSNDDASSPSAASTAALATLTDCVSTIVMTDVKYALCVMNSGLLALDSDAGALNTTESSAFSREGIVLSYIRAFEQQEGGSEDIQDVVGHCRLTCTAAGTRASSSCCQATERLRACELTPTLVTPALQACKASLDQSLAYSNDECGLAPADTAFVAIASVIVAVVVIVGGVLLYHRRRRKSPQQQGSTRGGHKNTLSNIAEQETAWHASLAQFLLQVQNLVWKNMVLRRRKPVAWLFEQVLPLLFVAALVVLANLDTIFGRNERDPVYASSDQAATFDNGTRLVCVDLSSLNPEDVGAPNSTMRSFYTSGQSVLGLFFLLSFVKFVSSTTAAMVHEKEIKMREMMKIMGVSDGMLLVAWCITHLLQTLPIVFVLTALLKYGNVFPTTPFATVVFLFWGLNVTIVAFSYTMTPWFRKSRTAAIFSVLIWLLLYFPFFAVQPKTSGPKYAAALSPGTAFALAIDYMLRQAQLGTGFSYSMTRSLDATSVVIEGVPTDTTMCWFMLIDAGILFVLGWYFEQVVPQQYGLTKPWNFMFKADYWRRVRWNDQTVAASLEIASPNTGKNDGSATPRHGGAYVAVTNDNGDDQVAYVTIPERANGVIEPVSGELAVQERSGASLQLHALSKTFKLADGEEKRAVDELTLTLYSGQITSLLGHNGAGKTTTISMLTGLLPPSSGDAVLYGKSLRRDTDAFRRIMGVCPQHDVLFPDLTVDEHLHFFATIKHVDRRALYKMADSLIEEVGLTGSRRVLSKNLSGGQKRKLSVAIALLGESKLVFFDEPTSGMDPYSRRFTWNMLRKQRDGRVIVLTTHFMDEADVLGDRIAILADGRLKCVGSSLFLKNRFGAGYNLTMIKAANATETGFNLSALEQLVQQHVPHASVASDSGSEVVFQLPNGSSTAFPALFDSLDRDMATLGMLKYGISVTTLEDVFLRIAHERDDEAEHAAATHAQVVPHSVTIKQEESATTTARPGLWAQYKTLLWKRVQISRRDRKSLLNAVGIPLLFLVILVSLPEIQVSSFLPDYATSLPTDSQRASCSTADISANILDARTLGRCENSFFAYCQLGLIECDNKVCCDATDYRSPLYACNACSATTGTCYNNLCLARNGAKLQIALNGFLASMVVMLAFAFVPAALIAFIVKEKEPTQDAKTLQWISGMSLKSYWWSNYTHDIVLTFVSVVVALLTTPFSNRTLAGSSEVLALVLLFVTHALAIVPMTYLYARRFQKHATAQTSMLVFTLASGGLLSIFSFMCRIIDFRMSSSLSLSGLDLDYLRWIFLLFPGYALNNGIYEIATRKLTRGSVYGSGRNWNRQASFFGLFRGFGRDLQCPACWNSTSPTCCVREVMDFDVVIAPVVYMALEAVVLTVLVFVMEKRAVRREHKLASKIRADEEKKATKQLVQESAEEEDDDVVAERHRVESEEVLASNTALLMRQLRLRYADGRVALNDLSLAIPRGECFGYLGVNGAGKSTTIKVLTRQIAATRGVVAVAGRELSAKGESKNKEATLIGYCPQFDALHDLLTVEEQLRLYASLKGIPSDLIAHEIDDKITQLGLGEYRHKLTRGLSGGNKRKVSTAIALLGSPPIVILDEPSTGMDPSSRRRMWNVIAATCAGTQRTSVLLTTHSMEECEALCSRVGILVQGQLKCLGSVEHLRQKFGRGFTVDVKLESEPTSDNRGRLESVVRSFLTRDGVQDVPEQLNTEQVESICNELQHPERSAQLTSGETRDVWLTSSLGLSSSDEFTIDLDLFYTWWLALERHEALQQHLHERFPGMRVVEQHGDHFRFHIPKYATTSDLPLRPKAIFEALEANRARLQIQEYSVSDTSLEHIFNSMAGGTATQNDTERASTLSSSS
ncbi:hypothetical protein Poli38472_001458 [Pythium oligandrum]|uniref:ABC transporter domain-containing protein n=1 Tax=Pythium oligandrum TaxID=41045 RepID=A0A8K1FRS7_PYTOL|nr:hypothetical protein Poli38472_001458 [Pythium oligandrum]|eukprot:TMW69302.1 hypothetical protein Poli38472_001458 [Pythium oligandrum]